jgi:hypothetical protein
LESNPTKVFQPGEYAVVGQLGYVSFTATFIIIPGGFDLHQECGSIGQFTPLTKTLTNLKDTFRRNQQNITVFLQIIVLMKKEKIVKCVDEDVRNIMFNIFLLWFGQ